jgi:hypothetical protein
MEIIISCRQLLDMLRVESKKQTEAIALLGDALAREAEQVHRQDQAQSLLDLKTEVMHKVAAIRQKELDASHSVTRWALDGGIEIVVSYVINIASGSASTSPTTGLKELPYGTVRVKMGHDLNKPVNVINVSQMARESRKPEAELEVELEAQGYFVIVPETFSEAVDKLANMLLKGIVTLPVAEAKQAPSQLNADPGQPSIRALVPGTIFLKGDRC